MDRVIITGTSDTGIPPGLHINGRNEALLLGDGKTLFILGLHEEVQKLYYTEAQIQEVNDFLNPPKKETSTTVVSPQNKAENKPQEGEKQ